MEPSDDMATTAVEDERDTIPHDEGGRDTITQKQMQNALQVLIDHYDRTDYRAGPVNPIHGFHSAVLIHPSPGPSPQETRQGRSRAETRLFVGVLDECRRELPCESLLALQTQPLASFRSLSAI